MSEEVVLLLEQKITEAQDMAEHPAHIVWKDWSSNQLDVSMTGDSNYTMPGRVEINVQVLEGGVKYL